jgi:hypothetical protein
VGVPFRDRERRSPIEIGRCLRAPGAEKLEVQSLDDGPPAVFVVASRESRYALRRRLNERPARARGPVAMTVDLARQRLPGGGRLTFYWPELRSYERDLGSGRRAEVFANSGALFLKTGNFWSQLLAFEPNEAYPQGRLRVADVTGVATLAAAGSGRPRVVLVVLGERETDASHFRPGQIRELARRLHVPLEVWSFSESPPAEWGETFSVRLPEGKHQRDSSLAEGHNRLRDRLEGQRVAWVRGGTALHRIAADTACAGFALVE